MQTIRAIVVGLILLFAPSGAVFADSVFNVDFRGAGKYSLDAFVSVLEDKNNQLTINDVSSAAFSSRFESNQRSYLNFGFSSSTFWLRFKLRYEDSTFSQKRRTPLFLEVAVAQLDVAELYIPQADGTFQLLKADVRQPYRQRDVKHVNSVFPLLPHLGQEQTLYVRVEDNLPVFFPVILWKPDAFSEKVAAEEFLYGIFWGGMLTMVAFNFLVFLSVRDVSYLLYVCYLVMLMAFDVFAFGHGVMQFENGTELFANENLPFVGWGSIFLGISVVRRFLDIKNQHPRLESLLTIMWIDIAINMVLSYQVDHRTALVGLLYFGTGFALFIIFSTMYCWYKGNKSAGFFCVSWLINAAGFGVFVAIYYDVLPPLPVFLAAAPLGTFISNVFLSFSLAERIKLAKKNALLAKMKATQSLAMYSSVFNNAIEGMYQLSLDGRFENANPAMARLLGYRSAKRLFNAGKNAVATCYDDAVTQYAKLKEYGYFHSVLYFELLGGKPTWIIHSARLIRSATGRPLHIQGSLVDITAHKEREKAEYKRVLSSKEKELAKAQSASKSAFLTTMSFDIRTLLTAIIGFGEALKTPGLSLRDKQQAIETVTHSSLALLALINDILDFSKIEAGKMAMESMPVDLFQLVSKVQAHFEKQAQDLDLSFNVNFRFPLPKEILSDPTRLKQILHNLCINALNATHKGSISLDVGWNPALQKMQFSVADTGIGMPSAQLGQWIEAFRRGDFTTANAMGECGLGLMIAKRLLTLMGGDLEVQSEPGHGSRFTATVCPKLPDNTQWVSNLSEAKAPDVSPTKYQSDCPPLTGRVLLVEDNVVNQQLISRYIKKTGAQVSIACNGAEALEKALVEPFDLILMDVNMPVMGGLEATQSLRQAGYSKPIYSLTAEQGQAEIDAALAAGSNGHLSKPVDLEKFYAVLALHCAKGY